MTGEIFLLPDLGEGLTEAEIVQWHVSEGQHVTAGQPLVSVETDKAVVEIPSPRSGAVAKLHAVVGEKVSVGSALLAFETEANPDRGTVVGTLDRFGEGKNSEGEPAADEPEKAHIKAAPAARKLARELGVELATVVPSGKSGTVTREDVLRATGVAAGEPLRGVRRAMAERMQKAHAEVAAATVTERANIDAWAGTAEQSPTMMPRLIRAVIEACRAVPALNAWYFAELQERQLHETIDLGIAVDSEDGLFVPVLRDAGAKTSDDLDSALRGLVAAVRERTIEPAALKGATITLSNYGTFGGLFATMLVVPPQVAIVGAGRARLEILATPEGPRSHVLLPLSLTFDHRVVSGGEAARFLSALVEDLEKKN